MSRRLFALLIGLLLFDPMVVVGLPAFATTSLLLRQWRTAWALIVGWIGLLVAKLAIAGPLTNWEAGGGESIGKVAVAAVPLVAALAVVGIGGLYLVGLVLARALSSPIDQPTREPVDADKPVPFWAWFFAPTGVVQLLQGKPAKACLYGTAFCLAGQNLLLALAQRGELPQGDLPFTWPLNCPDPVAMTVFLGLLWLAAIWDAWDTQRKARQEQPVQEGSPSPA